MLNFSQNPDVAEQQMNAIIFYLTAFGYIDGEFDFTEKTFVRIYIRQLVTARAKAAMPDADAKTRDEVVNKFVGHFHEVFEQIDRSVKDIRRGGYEAFRSISREPTSAVGIERFLSNISLEVYRAVTERKGRAAPTIQHVRS